MAMLSVCINRTTAHAPFRFEDLLKLQDHAVAAENPTLFLAEVEPVITLGQRQWVQWSKQPQLFADSPVPVVAGYRGGNETWHGPGQWVGFVVVPMNQWVKSGPNAIRRSILKILGLLLPIVQSYLPDATIEEGELWGIWWQGQKVVSIGVRISRGWIQSGFSLNAFQTGSSFQGISPCGLKANPGYCFQENLSDSARENEFQRLAGFIGEQFCESVKKDTFRFS